MSRQGVFLSMMAKRAFFFYIGLCAKKNSIDKETFDIVF